MKRLYKARISEGNCKWMFGYYCYSLKTKLPCLQDAKSLNIYHIIPKTLCEITHKTDVNNNRICENNIIETENGFILQCVWNDKYNDFLFKNLKGDYDFMVGMISELSSFTKGEVKIIGNIYNDLDIRKVG